jgi:hypothetical protein
VAINLKERFMVDGAGNRVAVLIDIEEYQKVLDPLKSSRQ